MRVMNNIYQVLGGAYANIANIFVLKGDQSLVLVDTAETPEEWAIIEDNLRYWRLDQWPISHVLISHKHLNHIGNAHVLQQRGACIVAGAGDADAIESGDINEICDFGPFPSKPPYIPCPIDLRVNDGDVVRAAGFEFKVISVPGHTRGSVFYQLTIENKIILFTGDVLNVGPDCASAKLGWEGGVDFDRQASLASIRKVAHLPCDVILPGHFQLCLQDGSKILQLAYAKALTHWRQPAVETE